MIWAGIEMFWQISKKRTIRMKTFLKNFKNAHNIYLYNGLEGKNKYY